MTLPAAALARDRCPLGCVIDPERRGTCQALTTPDAQGRVPKGRLCWGNGAWVCPAAYDAWVAADRPVAPGGARAEPFVIATPQAPLPPVFREAPRSLDAWSLYAPHTAGGAPGTFHDELQADLRKCARFLASDWRQIDERPWLLLLGNTGTGKTLLLRILGRLALDAGLTVRYTLFQAMVDDIKSTRDPDSGRTEQAAVQSYVRPDILIVDDVRPIAKGDAGKTEEIAHEILTQRYGEDLGEPRRPTWAASNLSVRELTGVIGAPAFDRFLHGGVLPWFCMWPSYRRKESA